MAFDFHAGGMTKNRLALSFGESRLSAEFGTEKTPVYVNLLRGA
jgi:hypothetical protein